MSFPKTYPPAFGADPVRMYTRENARFLRMMMEIYYNLIKSKEEKNFIRFLEL